MFCRNCGQFNEGDSFNCIKCGSATELRHQPSYMVETIPTYLVQAILVTLFCCMPFGIVAIVYAATAQSKNQVGDTNGAMIASNSAGKWCWASFWLGILPAVIWLLFVIISIIAGITSEL